MTHAGKTHASTTVCATSPGTTLSASVLLGTKAKHATKWNSASCTSVRICPPARTWTLVLNVSLAPLSTLLLPPLRYTLKLLRDQIAGGDFQG